jgi:hypothetical protein
VPQRSESDLNSHLEPIYDRLRNIEAQLAILSKKADVPYATVADVVPTQVIALVQAGDRINAIKLLPGADRRKPPRYPGRDRQPVGPTYPFG